MPREDDDLWETDEDEPETEPDTDTEEDEDEDELPEELRERLEAERERVRSEMEAEFKQHKAQYGKRFGNARSNLKEIGFDVDEDGNVVIRDPQSAMQKLMGVAPPQPKQDEDPEPDMWTDTDNWKAWSRRQAVKAAKAELTSELEPLKQQLAQLQRGSVQQVLPQAEQKARDYIESLGFGELADAPEFSQFWQKAAAQAGPEQLSDELAIETMAAMMLPSLRRAVGNGNGKRTTRDTREVVADLHRNSAVSTGRARSTTRAMESDYSREEVETARAFGMTPEEWRAFGDEQSALSYVEKQGRKNGRR